MQSTKKLTSIQRRKCIYHIGITMNESNNFVHISHVYTSIRFSRLKLLATTAHILWPDDARGDI